MSIFKFFNPNDSKQMKKYSNFLNNTKQHNLKEILQFSDDKGDFRKLNYDYGDKIDQKSMYEKINQEQNHLKDHIEDILDKSFNSCDEFIRSLCKDLDDKDVDINRLNENQEKQKVCLRAMNKRNADISFEVSQLKSMNTAMAADISQIKKMNQNKHLDWSEISDKLNTYMQEINQRNKERMTYWEMNEQDILNQYSKDHFNTQRSGQTKSTYNSEDNLNNNTVKDLIQQNDQATLDIDINLEKQKDKHNYNQFMNYIERKEYDQQPIIHSDQYKFSPSGFHQGLSHKKERIKQDAQDFEKHNYNNDIIQNRNIPDEPLENTIFNFDVVDSTPNQQIEQRNESFSSPSHHNKPVSFNQKTSLSRILENVKDGTSNTKNNDYSQIKSEMNDKSLNQFIQPKEIQGKLYDISKQDKIPEYHSNNKKVSQDEQKFDTNRYTNQQYNPYDDQQSPFGQQKCSHEKLVDVERSNQEINVKKDLLKDLSKGKSNNKYNNEIRLNYDQYDNSHSINFYSKKEFSPSPINSDINLSFQEKWKICNK